MGLYKSYAYVAFENIAVTFKIDGIFLGIHSSPSIVLSLFVNSSITTFVPVTDVSIAN